MMSLKSTNGGVSPCGDGLNTTGKLQLSPKTRTPKKTGYVCSVLQRHTSTPRDANRNLCDVGADMRGIVHDVHGMTMPSAASVPTFMSDYECGSPPITLADLSFHSRAMEMETSCSPNGMRISPKTQVNDFMTVDLHARSDHVLAQATCGDYFSAVNDFSFNSSDGSPRAFTASDTCSTSMAAAPAPGTLLFSTNNSRRPKSGDDIDTPSKRICRRQYPQKIRYGSGCSSSTSDMDSGLHGNSSVTGCGVANEAMAIIYEQTRACEELWQRSMLAPDNSSVRKRLELDFGEEDGGGGGIGASSCSPSPQFGKELTSSRTPLGDADWYGMCELQQPLFVTATVQSDSDDLPHQSLFTSQSTPHQNTMSLRTPSVVTPAARRFQLNCLRSAPAIEEELHANNINHNFNPYTPDGKQEITSFLRASGCVCSSTTANMDNSSPIPHCRLYSRQEQQMQQQRQENSNSAAALASPPCSVHCGNEPVPGNRTIDERFLNQMRFSLEFDLNTSHLLAQGSFGAVIAAQHRLDGVWYVVKTSRRRELAAGAGAGTSFFTTSNQFLSSSHSMATAGLGNSSAPSTAHQRYEAMQEVWALAGLREAHPHVLRYFGCWVQCDALYILLEFANGGSLDQLMWSDDQSARSTPPRALPLHRTVQLLAELTSALNFLHSHAMVHLDVKPANILLHLPGVALHPAMSLSDRVAFLDKVMDGDDDTLLFKLGDLGHVRDSNRLSQLEDGDGKYMPLDGLNLEHHQDPQKVDIYSLGLVLAEACGCAVPGPERQPEVRSALRQGRLPSLPLLDAADAAAESPYVQALSYQLRYLLTAMASAEPHARPTALELLMTPLLTQRLDTHVLRQVVAAQAQESRELRARVAYLEDQVRRMQSAEHDMQPSSAS